MVNRHYCIFALQCRPGNGGIPMPYPAPLYNQITCNGVCLMNRYVDPVHINVA
jgi:hypothetical protein